MAQIGSGWFPTPTRYASWPAWLSAALLALLALAVVFGVQLDRTPINADPEVRTEKTQERGADLKLYKRIVGEMRGGAGYYSAAAPALRDGNFPLQPFVAFRLPTLAWLIAQLGPTMARALIFALIAAVILFWAHRFRGIFEGPVVIAIALSAMVASLAVSMQAAMIYFHEIWAALLIALSLGLRRDDRWWPAVAAGLAAVLIRETALPYLFAMAVLAAFEARRREALTWLGAMLLFAVALLGHAQAVAAVTLASDPASPGWSALGGWRFFLSAMRLVTPLTVFPLWVAALVVPLALLGWGAWKSATGLRVTGTLCGYAVMFMLFGRPDNFYWGLLIAPLLFTGLVFTPAALRDLWRAVRSPSTARQARA